MGTKKREGELGGKGERAGGVRSDTLPMTTCCRVTEMIKDRTNHWLEAPWHSQPGEHIPMAVSNVFATLSGKGIIFYKEHAWLQFYYHSSCRDAPCGTSNE